MEMDNQRFILQAHAKIEGAAVVLESHPMRAMTYHLNIENDGILDHDDAESKKSKDKAAVWYKDEGGREKCIQLNVTMVDAKGATVKDRPVRLKCVLKYDDSGMQVINQDILKLWTDSSGFAVGAGHGPVIELKKGVARIKARIEDVSKNHQGQSFRIEVGPDVEESPTDCDVSARAD